MLRPARGITYLHGTNSLSAAAALMSGDPLRPRAFEGQARMALSVEGRSYLSPDVGVSCRYARAFPIDRKDRPKGSWENDYDGTGYVFAFELPEDTTLQVEEDDLGWAVRLALLVDAGYPTDTGANGLVLQAFGAALEADRTLLSRVAEQGRACIPASVLRHMAPPNMPTISMVAKAGRYMVARMDEEVAQALIDAGASVAVADPVYPTAGWQWLRAKHGPEDRRLPKTLDELIARSEAVDIQPAMQVSPGLR